MPGCTNIERLYDEHAQPLFAFLLNLTRDEADTRDVLQEHWCHGMKDKAQLSWVFGVAWVTMVKPGSLGFAEDSLSRKMAWPCD